MKYSVAVILIIVAVAYAEPPRSRGFLERQQAQQPSYPARGFRPAGPPFNLSSRSQRQQLPPTPAASYGPPPQEYGPPAATTTETPTITTEEAEATTLTPPVPISEKLTQQEQEVNPAALYVVVPQSQQLTYATSAKLVAEAQQPRLVPVQAVPAFARIQEVPQFAQVVDYRAGPAPLAAYQMQASAAYTSIVNTPYSYTFVQSFQ